jgi:hypothetical protein
MAESVQAGAIDGALALAERLVGTVEVFAAQFDLPELGAVELPPIVGSAADQTRLRTIPPLYLISELEAAGLLRAVEVLAGIFASGGLQGDLGPAAGLLVAFWQERNDRFSHRERTALFARLFGSAGSSTLAARGGDNASFENLMIDLTSALHELRQSTDLPLVTLRPSAVPLQIAAQQLAANLVPRGGGMAGFAARELLETIKRALEILKQEALQQGVGAQSVWGAVRSITSLYLPGEGGVDIASHVTRGKAGELVLAWLAEALPRIAAASGVLPADQPAMEAATAWLQASLTLHEHAAATPGPRG